MWHDHNEVPAPAIVISSLGGLVYGKDALSARDIQRGRMLRRVLKPQLAHLSRRQAYASPALDHHHYDSNTYESELIYNQTLATGATAGDAENDPPRRRADGTVLSIPSSSQQEAKPTLSAQQSQKYNNSSGNNSSSSCCGCSRNTRLLRDNSLTSTEEDTPKAKHHGLATVAGRGGVGWRPQGMLAGEWRDRTGKTRRARPTTSVAMICRNSRQINIAVASPLGVQGQNRGGCGAVGSSSEVSVSSKCKKQVGHSSTASVGGTSSCAGAEVSFEGLVQELRDRLQPKSPLMELVAAAQHNGILAYSHDNYFENNNLSGTSDDVDNRSEVRARAGEGERGSAVEGERERIRAVNGELLAKHDFPPGCLQSQRTVGGIPNEQQLEGKPSCSKEVERLGVTWGERRNIIGGRDENSKSTNNNTSNSSSHTGARYYATQDNEVILIRPSTSAVGMPMSSPAQGGTLFPDHTNSIHAANSTGVPHDRVDSACSPSAAMVAAAKAQERALPLLQVCAVQVTPSRGRTRVGKDVFGVADPL